MPQRAIVAVDGPIDPLTRARERFAVRDYHGAVLLLQEAIVEGLGYADAFNLLGLSLALVDRPDDALSAFDRALQLNPRYVEALLNRAIVLNQLGRMQEAERGFEMAAELGRPDASGFPALVANRLANAHANLAREYREAGALNDAIAQYRRALELRPAFTDIRLALARALTERGDYAEAGAALDEVLEMRPGSLDSLLLRGMVAYLQGDLDRAESAWTAAADAHPEEPRVEIYRSMLVRRRAGGRPAN